MTAPPGIDKISPYIADQTWSILTDHSQLRADLDARNLRRRPGSSRGGVGASQNEGAEQRKDLWRQIEDHEDVTFDRVVVTGPDGTPRPVSLRRMVLTTDSGCGKSIALEWFYYRFNRPDTKMLAFWLTASQLESEKTELQGPESEFNDRFENWLAGKIQLADQSGTCTLEAALQMVRRFRLTGRLVLLIDGLDHVSDKFLRLPLLLESPYWSKCRIILAGRPYVVQAQLKALGLHHGWQFLLLQELNELQWQRYLGSLYHEIPVQARSALNHVLTIPRMLYYLLHHVHATQFRMIRTGADVYTMAIEHLIAEGMTGSAEARRMGLKGPDAKSSENRDIFPAQIRQCRDLLAAIAYVMTVGLAEDRTLPSGITAPNFERLTAAFMGRLEEQVELRYSTKAANGLMQDMAALAAMNEFLCRGVFDSDVKGFRELEFRNRSLQEYLTAYYLSTKATQADGDLWWDRLYLPTDAQSEQFYEVWLFLAQMTGTARPGIDSDGTGANVPTAISPRNWLEAIEPLYRPAFPSSKTPSATQWEARRSCEMIFRTWPQLQKFCSAVDTPGIQARALQIRNRWLGEFDSIRLHRVQGTQRQQAAKLLVADFLRLPGGTFRMGSPPEKAGQMPDDERVDWIRWYTRRPEDETEVPRYVNAKADRWNWSAGRVGERERKWFTNFLTTLLGLPTESDMLRSVSEFFYPPNESPREPEQTVHSFLLGRSPVLNGWFRLFHPQHGLQQEFPDYSRISPDDAHPAIYVDWYSAWCFSRWVYFDGASCRLPWEAEWEYAAKYGTPWDWRYWWGDNWDQGRGLITADGDWRRDTTTPPDPKHANPATKKLDTEQQIGLQDLLGNVWEWCQDCYRDGYERVNGDDPGSADAFRSVRGGAFYNLPLSCRSGSRYRLNPAHSNRLNGVRLSRAASD